MWMEMRGDWKCVSIVPGGLCAVMNLTPVKQPLPVRHWEGSEEMVSALLSHVSLYKVMLPLQLSFAH